MGYSDSNRVATTNDSASDDLRSSGDSGGSGNARGFGDSGGSDRDGRSDGSGGEGDSDAPNEIASASAPEDSGGSAESIGCLEHPWTSNQLEDMKTFAWQSLSGHNNI
ncbi:hypothetical protein G6F42_028685 [Rhizopus arrhizus]|nr:hypothetical protein G6F42_028685 [Rhizopus arrhizus]